MIDAMNQAPSSAEQPRRAIADRYEVESVLGEGGMATVYQVLDTKTERHVALKRVRAADGLRAAKRRMLLEREYHTLAQLAHPRIIEVYDFGVDGDGPFYTMELLGGEDLDRSRRLPWPEVCSLLSDIASSLAIVHSRGLIHRDVSARNVRRGEDGRAKLIDFGAMTTVGVAKDVVGTAPFMAPEVLQLQALDPRVDLFALGALGYYLLTGRHAYPARRFDDLRDVWRSQPAPPARHAPEAPPALSALIMDLLRLDRSGRPRNAAEVMERLSAISGLPLCEQPQVSRAYLTTPVLIGRDRALARARKHLLSLVRGDGSTLLVTGVPGSGRSRLLDAAVFEAKLLGAVVLRADASDAASGDWAVTRVLGAQLMEQVPAEAQSAARVSRDVLSQVLDGLCTEETATALTERGVLIRELRGYVLTLARARRILIAIDDVDRIDEPSAALLAALAHKTERRPLMLALTADDRAAAHESASLRVLRGVAAQLACEQLSQDETEALMRSVFCDVANLPYCAGRIHALAQGNPRATMELAEHLVERGLARYARGSWVLPSRLDEHDLPSSLSAALTQRLAGLGADARELADALCLADGDSLALSDYGALTSHGDPTRVFRALDDLVAARVLVADAEHYVFAQRGFLAVLDEAMPLERRRALHVRIAERMTECAGPPQRRAHHLLGGGLAREAIELLAGPQLMQRVPPLPLLESAIAHAERLGEPVRVILNLRMAVLAKAAMLLDVESFHACYPHVLAALERASGLSLYRELSDEDPSNRLTLALTRTQERYLAAPEHERVMPVIEAIRELARLSGAFVTLAMSTFRTDLLDSLPSLAPLRPLSPAIGIVEQIVAAGKDYISGRGLRAQRGYEQAMARILEPDRAGLEETHHARTRLAIHYVLGLIQACMGASAAETHAAALAEDRELRVNAWRVRLIMHLTQGHAEEARKCRRRAELVQLQDGGDQRYPGTTAASELIAYVLASDAAGIKDALERVSAFAERHPAWRPAMHYGQCALRRLHGDPDGALAHVVKALAGVEPGTHSFMPYLAALHVDLLGELGRGEEAVSRAQEYLEVCTREQIETLHQSVHVATALALARAGRYEPAVQMIERVIEGAEQLGVFGLALGVRYEARARIALWMKDRAAFDHYAACCANEYQLGKNPSLLAKFGRLMEEAVVEQPAHATLPQHLLELASATTGGEYETLQSRLLECIDRHDRARCAITMLLQHTESPGAYLFGVYDELAIELLAAVPELPVEPAFKEWIRQSIAAELSVETAATRTGEREGDTLDLAPRYTDEAGRSYEPMWLLDPPSRRIAGVMALQVTSGPRTMPPRELRCQIAALLLEHGDVSGTAIGD
jgi:tetratricopeptide (TPR) repeat protein